MIEDLINNSNTIDSDKSREDVMKGVNKFLEKVKIPKNKEEAFVKMIEWVYSTGYYDAY